MWVKSNATMVIVSIMITAATRVKHLAAVMVQWARAKNVTTVIRWTTMTAATTVIEHVAATV